MCIIVCDGGCNTYRVGFDISKIRCFVVKGGAEGGRLEEESGWGEGGGGGC